MSVPKEVNCSFPLFYPFSYRSYFLQQVRITEFHLSFSRQNKTFLRKVVIFRAHLWELQSWVSKSVDCWKKCFTEHVTEVEQWKTFDSLKIVVQDLIFHLDNVNCLGSSDTYIFFLNQTPQNPSSFMAYLQEIKTQWKKRRGRVSWCHLSN